jgi:hypothetical protein
MEAYDEALRKNEADQRCEELMRKYAGRPWTAKDLYEVEINHAKNRYTYERIKDGKSSFHLWSEVDCPVSGKREAVCTVTTAYTDGRKTVETEYVMVHTLPKDSEETVPGKATVRFAWTEKKDGQEPKKVSHSTVCGLGNRLSSCMERKAAFKEAWRLAKAGKVQFAVSGVTFGSRQKALARLAQYSPKDIHAVLVPEPENRFDPNAVAVKVLVQGSPAAYKLGYVPASQTKIIKAFLGRVPHLSVVGGDLLGAKLSIAV